MQSKKLLLSAALFGAGFLPTSQAENWYAEGLAGGLINADSSDFTTVSELSLGSVGLRSGYQINDSFSVEGELQMGVGKEELRQTRYGTDVSIHSMAASFVNYTLPINDRLSLHSRLGVASIEFESEIVDDDGSVVDRFTDTYTGIGFGAGAEFGVTDNIYLRTDYTRYQANALDTNSILIGAGLRF